MLLKQAQGVFFWGYIIIIKSSVRWDKIVLKKWYTIFKDHIALEDYEIHDGMNLELYYQ